MRSPVGESHKGRGFLGREQSKALGEYNSYATTQSCTEINAE
jgi:hypothetical protein